MSANRVDNKLGHILDFSHCPIEKASIIIILLIYCVFAKETYRRRSTMEYLNEFDILLFLRGSLIWGIGLFVSRYASKKLLMPLYTSMVAKKNKVEKFAADIWKLAYYTFVTTVLIQYCLQKDYVPRLLGGNGKGFREWHLTNWPSMDSDELYYYQISFGFAVQTLIAHFIEPARRDFYTMLIHHIVLVGLVGFSYVNGWIQYGMIVFIVHDVSDISVYLIKIAALVKNIPLAIISSISWLTSWIYLRLILMPIYILWEIYTWVIDPPYFQKVQRFMTQIDNYVFFILLSTLYVLHWIWFFAASMQIKRTLDSGSVKDDPVNIGKQVTKTEESRKAKKVA